MFRCVLFGRCEVLFPGSAQAVAQCLKQNATVLYLLHHLEAFRDDFVSFAHCVHVLHGGGHLLLECIDTAQSLEVIHHVQNQRNRAVACRQGTADLLLVDDRADRGPEQNHSRDSIHMHAFIEHVDAEEQLQGTAGIRLEFRKRLAGTRIFGIGHVEMDVWIHSGKPGAGLFYHLAHVLHTGAEHDVFAAFARHVAGKHLLQAIRLLQCPAQGIQIFLVHIPQRSRPHGAHLFLVSLQLVLVFEHGGHILWGRQNSPDDRLTQGKFTCDMAFEQLFGHIAHIIQISFVGCGKAQQLCVGVGCNGTLYRIAPLLCTAPVEFIQNDIIRVYRQLFLAEEQQLGVGAEGYIGKLVRPAAACQTFQLSGINILAGTKPKDLFFRLVQSELKCNETFSGSGGVDDGCFACLFQHGNGGKICLLVVLKQFHRHMHRPLSAVYNVRSILYRNFYSKN